MSDHQHHDNLIESIASEYSDILDNSDQGVYIYLDDTHKVCNKKFATMLGYDSETQWGQIDSSFPDTFVDEDSQETLVTSFQDAMERMVGSVNSIVWKKKDGSTVATQVILVPIIHDNHQFALHFVTVS